MTDNLRDWIRRRRRVFGKEKKTPNWIEMRDKIAVWIKERKENYYREMKNNLAVGDSKNFFACVKGVINESNKLRWNPRMLYPDEDDCDIAENRASFLTKSATNIGP